MAIHLLRDYQTQNITTGNRGYIGSYLLSIFLRRVLSYSYVGDTNYPINAVGTLLIATGDSNPTGAASFSTGHKAGINLGTQKEFYVSIPSSIRTVSGVDIGRLLALKSASYPTFNSGIFVIIGIEISSNSYVIDYRTLGDKPPVEATDTIQWWLYDKDINCPISGNLNTSKTSSEYRSDGNSTTPRIILQSPHSLGWQVRICNESVGDFLTGIDNSTGNCPQITTSPGFNGNASGDFSIFGQHFHAPLWNDNSSKTLLGGAIGFGDGGGFIGLQNRITIIGDDTGQGIVMYCRRLLNATSPNSSIVCFGVPENEPTPLPIYGAARLFVIGSSFSGNDDFGNRCLNDGGFQYSFIRPSGGSNPGYAQGMSSTPFGTPCSATASFWTYIFGNSQGGGPHTNGSATDNPYTNSTDLLPIDVIQGTVYGWNQNNWDGGSNTAIYPLAPRTMGTIPHLREGRSNFGDFSPTTDPGRSYQHLRRGVYIPWNGPNLIP